MMPIENEKRYKVLDSDILAKIDKFIVNPDTTSNAVTSYREYELEQFYVAYDATRKYVNRYRKVSVPRANGTLDNYVNTQKIGRGEQCQEIELHCSDYIYNEMFTHFKIGNVITKRRYTIPTGNPDYPYWELDQFFGVYEGLFILEIELTNPNAVAILPSWIDSVDEVTDDFKYANVYMALANTEYLK